MAITLATSEIKTRPAELYAGLKIPVTENAQEEIPALWQEFMAQQPSRFAQAENSERGLCIGGEQGTEYVAAVQITPGTPLPHEWFEFPIPAAHFEVFPHNEPVWRLRETIEAIFAPGGLTHEHHPVNKLAFFEQYTAEFDPHTGLGGMSIWVPVRV
jgi:AraC family transcriptional regulator